MFFCMGTVLSVCTQDSFARMDKVYRKETHVASPHLPSKPNLSYIKVTPSAAPLCVKPAGQSLCILVCVCECVPGFPRVHQQLCRADGPLWYGGVILWGPQWSHRHCDQLCLPPAIGQGSYNRRFGGRGPPRTAPQLSRCGEGVGRGGLGSATVEERSNEVPRDGPMNHYQLCYI